MNTIHHIILILAIGHWPLAVAALLFAFFSAGITPAPVSPVKAAGTTIAWGTAPGGTQIAPLVSGIVPTSLNITPVNGGPVATLENADGSAIEQVYLVDGFDAELEIMLDTALTYPATSVAGALTLTLPVGIMLSGTAKHTVFPCTVQSYAPKFERKKEAMLGIKISHRPGVDGAATT